METVERFLNDLQFSFFIEGFPDYTEVYCREYAYKFQKEIGKFAVRFQEEF